MAQDPEHDEEQLPEGDVDTSHELDMVPLYSSQTVDAEIEADVLRGLLEANGIPSVISTSPYPNLGSGLQVPRGMLEDALRVIRDAQAAGPEAAAEAEAATEEGQ